MFTVSVVLILILFIVTVTSARRLIPSAKVLCSVPFCSTNIFMRTLSFCSKQSVLEIFLSRNSLPSEIRPT